MNKSELISFLKKSSQKILDQDTKIVIYLFGSRLTNNYSKNSDWDIAINLSNKEKNKTKFIIHIRDNLPSLNEIDIVDLATCNKKLRNEILKKGKIIYEQ